MGNKNSPKQSITIAQLTIQNIPEAVALHRKFMPSAGAKLGTTYLHKVYTILLTATDTHLVIGAYANHALVGLISVTNNPNTTDFLLNRYVISFIPTIVSGLIKRQFSIIDLFSHILVHRKIKLLSDKNTVHVLGIVVDPQFQRRGIASSLFDSVYLKWQPQHILIDTLKTNTHAQQFYKKIGFMPIAPAADSIIYCKMSL